MLSGEGATGPRATTATRLGHRALRLRCCLPAPRGLRRLRWRQRRSSRTPASCRSQSTAAAFPWRPIGPGVLGNWPPAQRLSTSRRTSLTPSPYQPTSGGSIRAGRRPCALVSSAILALARQHHDGTGWLPYRRRTVPMSTARSPTINVYTNRGHRHLRAAPRQSGFSRAMRRTGADTEASMSAPRKPLSFRGRLPRIPPQSEGFTEPNLGLRWHRPLALPTATPLPLLRHSTEACCEQADLVHALHARAIAFTDLEGP